jgi:hypothetical protein
MNAQIVAEKICPDVWQRVGARGDRSWIVTRFKYPDGDFINLYFEGFNGGIRASDFGHTIRKLHNSGVTLTEARRRFIAVVCRLHGIEFADDIVFRKQLGETLVGADCIALCQAIAKISNLDYESTSRSVPAFSSQVDFLVENRIRPYCTVTPAWNDPEIDPTGRFPVDYKFNGVTPPRFLFKVTSEEKRSRVGETYGFFAMKQRNLNSIAIVDEDAGIKDTQIDRLRKFMPTIIGLSGNEERITRFALEGVYAKQG